MSAQVKNAGGGTSGGYTLEYLCDVQAVEETIMTFPKSAINNDKYREYFLFCTAGSYGTIQYPEQFAKMEIPTTSYSSVVYTVPTPSLNSGGRKGEWGVSVSSSSTTYTLSRQTVGAVPSKVYGMLK